MKSIIASILISTGCLFPAFLNAQGLYQPQIARADSLFFRQEWASARKIYQAIAADTSLDAIRFTRLGYSNYNLKNYDEALINYKMALQKKPQPAALPVIYSRMAKVYAIKGSVQQSFTALDSALKNGYSQFSELDTLPAFNTLRNEEPFKMLRQHAFFNAYPCMADTNARKFDFWLGEWDVYQTGTKFPVVGHSLIQLISGGCALLENWDSGNSTGKSINFIDPITNKWKQSWSGSYTNGNQEFTDGEYKDSVMRFNYISTFPSSPKTIGHLLFYNIHPNEVRQLNEFSTDGGKTWTTSYDFTYIRRG